MILNYNNGYSNPAQSTVITGGQTLSAEINTGGMALCGVFIPASFTGVAITFQAASVTGGTYVDVTNAAGTSVTYVVASSKYVAIDPKDFQGIQFLKIKSGASEVGDKTLICSLKGL